MRRRNQLLLFSSAPSEVCTHHEKTDDGDDRNEDLASRSKGELEEEHQRLRGSKLIQRLDGRGAEENEEEEGCAEVGKVSVGSQAGEEACGLTESHDTGNGGGPEDSSCSGKGRIFNLLSNVSCEDKNGQPQFRKRREHREPNSYSPAASNPVMTYAQLRYERHQFHPVLAPVPLNVSVKTNLADRIP